MGCLLWVHNLNKALATFLSNCIQYRVIFDHDIVRIYCITCWTLVYLVAIKLSLIIIQVMNIIIYAIIKCHCVIWYILRSNDIWDFKYLTEMWQHRTLTLKNRDISGKPMPISWLQVSWLHVPPGYRKPLYCPCEINFVTSLAPEQSYDYLVPLKYWHKTGWIVNVDSLWTVHINTSKQRAAD